MARKRLTDADWRTIAYALNCAIEERNGYAEAYSYQGPEGERALASVKRFEALHVKIFGEASAAQKFAEECAAMPSVSIFKLGEGD